MVFNHVTEMPTGSTSLEISLDDKCIKFFQQYANQGKCSNQVHYIGLEHVKELRDYLSEIIVELELDLLEVAI